MARNKTQFSKNLRLYRKALCENTDELGEAIYSCGSAIRKYESGDRTPEPQTIQLLAEHIGITSEMLTSSFPEIIYNSTPFLDDEKLQSLSNNAFRAMFPVFRSKSALENKSFSRAYQLHQELFSVTDLDLLDEKVDEVHSLYTDAYNKGDVLLALVNDCFLSLMLWRYFYFYYQIIIALESYDIPDDESFPIEKILLLGMRTSPLDESAESIRRELYENITENLQLIKKHQLYPDICEYLTGICFVNMIDGELPQEPQLDCGLNLLEFNAKTGNEYAKRFIDTHCALYRTLQCQGTQRP